MLGDCLIDGHVGRAILGLLDDQSPVRPGVRGGQIQHTQGFLLKIIDVLWADVIEERCFPQPNRLCNTEETLRNAEGTLGNIEKALVNTEGTLVNTEETLGNTK
jgi:hypothetical protein